MLLGIALAWVGCERADASLMRIDAVTQDEEAGLLFVQGEGFFAGEKCTAKLRGSLFRTAGGRSPTTRSWPCRARSEQQLVVQLPSASTEPSGLLEATLQVSFTAKGGERTFVGRSERDVRIRLAQNSLAEVLKQSRAARAFAEEIGLSLEPSTHGLLVTQLHPQGRAAQAGLRTGDIIVRLDGAPTERPTDLVPSPQAGAPVLEILRGTSSLSIAFAGQGTLSTAPFSASHGLALAIAFLTVMLLPFSSWSVGELVRRRLALCAAQWRALVLGAGLTMANAAVFSFGSLDARCAFLAPWFTCAVLQVATERLSTRERLRILRPSLRLAVGMGCLVLLAEQHTAFPVAPTSFWLVLCTPAAWLAWLSLQSGLPRVALGQSLSVRVSFAWLIGTTAWLIARLAMTGRTNWFEAAGGGLRGFVLAVECGVIWLWLLGPTRLQTHQARWLWPLLALLLTLGWLLFAPNATGSSLIGYACSGTLLALALKQLVGGKQRAALLRADPMLEPFR